MMTKATMTFWTGVDVSDDRYVNLHENLVCKCSAHDALARERCAEGPIDDEKSRMMKFHSYG